MAIVTKKSILTGCVNTMELPVPQKRVEAWLGEVPATRPYVQTAFPDLTDEEREFLISGVTPEEWNELLLEELMP